METQTVTPEEQVILDGFKLMASAQLSFTQTVNFVTQLYPEDKVKEAKLSILDSVKKDLGLE